MGRFWLFDMPTVLQAVGLDVSTHPGWELRSRSTGGLDAILGIVAHHDADATSGNDSDAERYMWDNAASRPIGNVHLRRSGMWVVGAAGASNTQGKGGPVTGSQGTVVLDQGNRYMIAVEAANNGIGETWSRVQLDSYLTGLAAMCEHWDLDPGRDIWTHAGYCEPSCPGRKVDPAGPTPSHPSLGGRSGRATWSQTALRDLTAAVLIPKPVEPPPAIPVPAQPFLEEPMYIVRDPDGRIRIGDGITQVVWADDKDKAVAFALTRAIRAGRPLLSDDGTRCQEVRKVGDILDVEHSGARSLGRGGVA